MARVLAYICSEGSKRQLHFTECILGTFRQKDSCYVECNLENNTLLLRNFSDTCNSDESYLLKHPSFCPVKELQFSDILHIPQDILERGVDVGVATIIESCDKQILVTRRSPHLSTFPRVWVPPGGHIELGETLQEAALRELQEETGISLMADKITSKILGLWESVYPPMIYISLPKRHHIVVYLHLLVNASREELQKLINLNNEEVDASIWLKPLHVYIAVNGLGGIDISEKHLLAIANELKYTYCNENGEHEECQLDYNTLLDKIPLPGCDVERISTGTRYALSLWLKTLPNNDNPEGLFLNLCKNECTSRL